LASYWKNFVSADHGAKQPASAAGPETIFGSANAVVHINDTAAAARQPPRIFFMIHSSQFVRMIQLQVRRNP
jgi:hypothetical protein